MGLCSQTVSLGPIKDTPHKLLWQVEALKNGRSKRANSFAGSPTPEVQQHLEGSQEKPDPLAASLGTGKGDDLVWLQSPLSIRVPENDVCKFHDPMFPPCESTGPDVEPHVDACIYMCVFVCVYMYSQGSPEKQSQQKIDR